MKKYQVCWRDQEGEVQCGDFRGYTPTEAMAAAMEEVELLKSHPHLINRVLEADRK
jgi:hypothetical protein